MIWEISGILYCIPMTKTTGFLTMSVCGVWDSETAEFGNWLYEPVVALSSIEKLLEGRLSENIEVTVRVRVVD